MWAQLLILVSLECLAFNIPFVAAIDAVTRLLQRYSILSPIYIIIFVSWTRKIWPPIPQVLGMIITLIGLFLLLTNGSLSGFVLSKIAVIWGIALGFAFTFYTLYPARLMAEWGVLLSVAWAMIIGGLALFITNPISIVKQLPHLAQLDITFVLFLVIVVGTAAFILFLSSMKYITPIETSILSSFEPLTAIIVSVIWFGQVLGMWQLTGSIIMLLGVTWISIAGSKGKKVEKYRRLRRRRGQKI